MPLVLLDPGHNPDNDPGAVGNSIREADITFDLCRRIAAKLPSYGVKATVIQPTNETLEEVVAIANTVKDADFFLSIHVNSAANTGATGFESYVYPGSNQSDKLRSYIHAEVAKFFQSYNFVDRGKRTANFYILRETAMPAMLFENLFISNKNDAEKLKNSEFLDGLAAAYCTGIAQALGTGITGGSGTMVPAWAKDAITWGTKQGLINTQEGSEDFYRFMTILYRYDKLRFGSK